MAKAKTKNSSSELITGAAEVVGGALGTIAGTIDRLKADHPHPVQEAKDALAAGQAQLTGFAGDARDRTSAVIEATKGAITTVRRQAVQTKRKGRKIVKKTKQAARKTVKTTKQAARKTVKRAKKILGRARKTASRGRARARRK